MKLAVVNAWEYSENGPFKRLLRGCLERAGIPGWGFACQATFCDPWDRPKDAPTLLLGKETAKIVTGFDFKGKGCEIQNIRGSLLPTKEGWATLTIEPELISVGWDKDPRGVPVGGKAQAQFYPYLVRDIKEVGASPYVPKVTIVTWDQALRLFQKEKPEKVSLDIEGADGNPNLVGLAWSKDQAYVMKWVPEVRDALQYISDHAEFILHNASYDIPELMEVGLVIPIQWDDTINTAAILNPESKMSLQAQVLSYLPGAITWKGLVNHVHGPDYEDQKVKTYRELWRMVLKKLNRRVPNSGTEWYCFYNGLDTAYTYALQEQHKAALEAEGRWSYYTTIAKPIQKPLIHLGLRPLPVDPTKLEIHKKGCERLVRMANAILGKYGYQVLEKQEAEMGALVQSLTEEREEAKEQSGGKRFKFRRAKELTAARNAWRLAKGNLESGFNGTSNKQRTMLLYDILKLPVKKKRGTKGRSADEMILEKLKSQLVRKTIKVGNPDYTVEDGIRVINAMLAATKWSHWKGNYLNPPLKNGGVVTAYAQHRHSAARLSSGLDTSDPDKGTRQKVQQLQNIPKSLRDIFIPDPGCSFIGADWSNIQWGLTILSITKVPKEFLFEQWELDPERDRWYLQNRKKVIEAYTGSYYQDLLKKFREGEFDAHRYLASFAYGKREEDVKKDERQSCKPYTHGYNFDGWPGTLADEADQPRAVGMKVCRAHDVAFMTRPWKEWMFSLTQKSKYTQTPAGWRRYFFDLKIKNTEVLGTQIQAQEGDLMKWLLARIAEEEPGVFDGSHPLGWLIATTTHDSLLFQSPRETEKECAEWVKAQMERPIPWLDGRSWRADVKIGKNWKEVG